MSRYTYEGGCMAALPMVMLIVAVIGVLAAAVMLS